VCGLFYVCIQELRRFEDINMQLLSKLENISRSAAPGAVAALQGETSLFAELEILSHSMSVDSLDFRSPATSGTHKVTIGTQLKQEILEVSHLGNYFNLQILSLCMLYSILLVPVHMHE